jgi:hypothetical protein
MRSIPLARVAALSACMLAADPFASLLMAQSRDHAPLIVAKPVEKQEGEIQEAFRAFQTALLQGDGPAIPSLVNAASIEFYGRMRDIAIKADESATRNLPLAEKSIVLKMRKNASAEELRRWSSREVLAQGLGRGWLFEEPAGYVEPGKVEFENNEGHAAALENNRPLAPEYALHFMREGSDWKLDLYPLRLRAAKILYNAVMQEGRSADEFLIRGMQKESGLGIGPEIWKGPLR